MWTDLAATSLLRANTDPAFAQIARDVDAHARASGSPDLPSRPCPACGAVLAPTLHVGVTVDTCASHGTFFDRGEVTRIRATMLAEKDKLTPGAVALGILEVLSFFA
jgi:hypothetical protein